MCFSSLVLSRPPKIFKTRPKSPQNPLTPIGSCWKLHICSSKPITHPLGRPSYGGDVPWHATSRENATINNNKR